MMNLEKTKKVVIQNVHSELVLTVNKPLTAEYSEKINVIQDNYEKGHSGERFIKKRTAIHKSTLNGLQVSESLVQVKFLVLLKTMMALLFSNLMMKTV